MQGTTEGQKCAILTLSSALAHQPCLVLAAHEPDNSDPNKFKYHSINVGLLTLSIRCFYDEGTVYYKEFVVHFWVWCTSGSGALPGNHVILN